MGNNVDGVVEVDVDVIYEVECVNCMDQELWLFGEFYISIFKIVVEFCY